MPADPHRCSPRNAPAGGTRWCELQFPTPRARCLKSAGKMPAMENFNPLNDAIPTGEIRRVYWSSNCVTTATWLEGSSALTRTTQSANSSRTRSHPPVRAAQHQLQGGMLRQKAGRAGITRWRAIRLGMSTRSCPEICPPGETGRQTPPCPPKAPGIWHSRAGRPW